MRLWWTLCAVALSALPSGAQSVSSQPLHQMEIADATGNPIGHAQVLVTAIDGPATILHSGAQGKVGPMILAADTVIAVVRSIGFQPATVEWIRSIPLRVVLEPITTTLSAVEVRAIGRCRDDASARGLWNAVAATYASPGNYHVDGESQLFAVQDGRETVSHDQSPFGYQPRFVRAAGFQFVHRRIQSGGWRWPLTGTSIDPSAGLYEYPALDAEMAAMLTDSLFAASHRFSAVRQSESGQVIYFCPQDDRRGALTGSFTIDTGTLRIISANWQYSSRDGRETAGGSAIFAPVSVAGTRQLLLPVTSDFWRASGGILRYQRSTAFRNWQVRPSP